MMRESPIGLNYQQEVFWPAQYPLVVYFIITLIQHEGTQPHPLAWHEHTLREWLFLWLAIKDSQVPKS